MFLGTSETKEYATAGDQFLPGLELEDVSRRSVLSKGSHLVFDSYRDEVLLCSLFALLSTP